MGEFGPGSLLAYLTVAGLLFTAGVLAVATRRSAIGVLLGTELMLNAAALQFVAYERLRAAAAPHGQTAAALVIVVAAAEAAIALSLLFAVYRTARDVDLEQTRELRS